MKLKRKKFNILSDTSFWDIPVPDYFRFEITKRGSASFLEQRWAFDVAARQDGIIKRVILKADANWRENATGMDDLLPRQREIILLLLPILCR